jgi:hypothetical protein
VLSDRESIFTVRTTHNVGIFTSVFPLIITTGTLDNNRLGLILLPYGDIFI